jgi:hypothetical protein
VIDHRHEERGTAVHLVSSSSHRLDTDAFLPRSKCLQAQVCCKLLVPRCPKRAHAPCCTPLTLALSRCGFPDRGAYYHPLFVRGDRDLCKHIRRIKRKGTGPRKPSRPDEQPDFYRVGSDPFCPATITSYGSLQPSEGGVMTCGIDDMRPPPAISHLSSSVPAGPFPVAFTLARSLALSFPGLVPPPSSGVGLADRLRPSASHPGGGGGSVAFGNAPPSRLSMPPAYPPASAHVDAARSLASVPYKELLLAAVAAALRTAAAPEPVSSQGGTSRSGAVFAEAASASFSLSSGLTGRHISSGNIGGGDLDRGDAGQGRRQREG